MTRPSLKFVVGLALVSGHLGINGLAELMHLPSPGMDADFVWLGVLLLGIALLISAQLDRLFGKGSDK